MSPMPADCALRPFAPRVQETLMSPLPELKRQALLWRQTHRS